MWSFYNQTFRSGKQFEIYAKENQSKNKPNTHWTLGVNYFLYFNNMLSFSIYSLLSSHEKDEHFQYRSLSYSLNCWYK